MRPDGAKVPRFQVSSKFQAIKEGWRPKLTDIERQRVCRVHYCWEHKSCLDLRVLSHWSLLIRLRLTREPVTIRTNKRTTEVLKKAMADIGGIKDYVNFMIDEAAKVQKQTVDPQTREITTAGEAKILAALLHSNRANLKKKKTGGKGKNAAEESEQENEEDTGFALEVPADKSQERATIVVGEADMTVGDTERERRTKVGAYIGGSKHVGQKVAGGTGGNVSGQPTRGSSMPQKRKIVASSVPSDPSKKMKVGEKNVAEKHVAGSHKVVGGKFVSDNPVIGLVQSAAAHQQAFLHKVCERLGFGCEARVPWPAASSKLEKSLDLILKGAHELYLHQGSAEERKLKEELLQAQRDLAAERERNKSITGDIAQLDGALLDVKEKFKCTVDKTIADTATMANLNAELAVLKKERAEREDTIAQLQEALTSKEKELADFQSARQEEMAKLAEDEREMLRLEAVDAFKKSTKFKALLTDAGKQGVAANFKELKRVLEL